MNCKYSLTPKYAPLQPAFLHKFTGNKITGPRKIIRDEGAWCAELWRNPGKYSKPYKRPDGSTGTTSGMKLRTAVGKPGFSLPTAD